MHTYMHTYIHTYMHTYMHTYIHTYMHVCMCENQIIDLCTDREITSQYCQDLN
jgi:hypothetical protein